MSATREDLLDALKAIQAKLDEMARDLSDIKVALRKMREKE